MIDISFLYTGTQSQSTSHRYGTAVSEDTNSQEDVFPVPRSAIERHSVVVWNVTRTCNLRCLHCYSDSESARYDGELTTEEAKDVIDDLAGFGVPVILFSGGEPLVRSDIFELAQHAREKGIRTTLSTNGTLVTPPMAQKIKSAGFSYVGVSLDGIGLVHDRFRGMKGAFEQTLFGIRYLIALGQKTGLRLTLTTHTIDEIDHLFDLIEREKIDRVCFYHLVPSGRGRSLYLIDPKKVRRGIDRILERTEQFSKAGRKLEVLTVDNHADGPYLYLKLKQRNDPRAGEVYEGLAWNGGGLYSSGVGIACIDSQGNVHPDQFWTHYSLGNVRSRKFSEIWSNPNEPLLQKLRNRAQHIRGRCRGCQFLNLCGGALRARADIVTGDPWASDPACYLTDEEIGVK